MGEVATVGQLRKQRLRDQLAARRKVPSGSRLPRPENATERILFDGLMALPDQADPFEWLLRTHAALAGRMALHLALLSLEGMIRAALQALRAGHSVPTDVTASLGGLLQASLDHNPFLPLRAHTDDYASTETLTAVLREVQALRGPVEVNPASSYLGEVFDAPANEDLIDWMLTRFGDWATTEAVFMVLLHAGASGSIAIGRVRTRFLPKQRIRHDRLDIAVDEVVLGEAGFSLSFQTVVATGSLKPPQGFRVQSAHWGGFTRASDDLGNEYLLQNAGSTSVPGRWWWPRRTWITTSFCPAVEADARQVTLRSAPALVEVQYLAGDGSESRSEIVNLGDLAWTFPLHDHPS